MPHTNIQWFRYGLILCFHKTTGTVVGVVTPVLTLLADIMARSCSVQHHELLSHRSLPLWDGCDDHAENLTQGHRQIQPGGPGKVFIMFSQVK